jgi:pyridoxamine 5'-phosphate oxidase
VAEQDPLRTLEAWIAEAGEVGDLEPTAMALATVDPDGMPSVRYVLCKAVTPRGVRFFTNLHSRKGRALATEPRAAVTFWWPVMERAVRITGITELLPREEVDAYFASRPRGSRIGAFASDQSRPVKDRGALEGRQAEVEARFTADEPTRAPDDWGGYELIAGEIELWQGRDDRIHDRLRFVRSGAGNWLATRLQP